MTHTATIGALNRIADTAEMLRRIASSQAGSENPDFERLLDAYLEARSVLRSQFQIIAKASLSADSSLLSSTLAAIRRRSLELYGDDVPHRYLEVPKSGGVKGLLLEYLARHVGKPVPASRLRVLAGDQIHTERRIRELRDLGFEISWKRTGGEEHYLLKQRKFQSTEQLAFSLSETFAKIRRSIRRLVRRFFLSFEEILWANA